MTSRRVQKAAQAIREVVSMAIIAELNDPRIEDVTVTFVEVSGDMRSAKVHVSVMGDETKQQLCLHGLRSSAGFLQSKIATRIDTRYTPRLKFELDMGVKHSIALSKMLIDVLPEESKDNPSNDVANDDVANDDVAGDSVSDSSDATDDGVAEGLPSSDAGES